MLVLVIGIGDIVIDMLVIIEVFFDGEVLFLCVVYVWKIK